MDRILVVLQQAKTTIGTMLDFRQRLINSTRRKVPKRLHYPLEVMLTCAVEWTGDAVDFLLTHRAIKRIIRPMMGFKSFWSARIIIAGIQTIHMMRKGQLDCPGLQPASAANVFYSLAAR